MKKRFTLIILGILIFPLVSNAQNTYAKISCSYNFSNTSRTFDTYYFMKYVNAGDYVRESHTSIKSSLGRGFLGNVALGYNFKRSIGLELNISYLQGRAIKYTNELEYYLGSDFENFEIAARAFILTPTLVYYKDFDFASPYISMGLALSIISAKEKYAYEPYDFYNGFEIENSYNRSASIGIIGKFGIQKNINDKVAIYGELAFASINFSPEQSELIMYEFEGSDELNTLNISQRNTNYVDDYEVIYEYNEESQNWEESWDEDKPRDMPKEDYPFSFVSLTVGVRILFLKNNTQQTPME